jgi:hypothetical protein
MPMERASKKTGLRNQLSSLNLKEGAPEVKRGPGRPSTGDAKKGNPDYKLTTVFLPKRVYADAQAKLLKANAERDQKRTVSDVLSDYLTEWVNQ